MSCHRSWCSKVDRLLERPGYHWRGPGCHWRGHCPCSPHSLREREGCWEAITPPKPRNREQTFTKLSKIRKISEIEIRNFENFQPKIFRFLTKMFQIFENRENFLKNIFWISKNLKTIFENFENGFALEKSCNFLLEQIF